MSFFKILLPCLVYGIAWQTGTNHPIMGFIVLLIGGFIVGFTLFYKDFFIQMVKTAIIAVILGGIAATGIGAIITAIVVLYFAYKQFKLIMEHLPLMAVGCFLYFLILCGPSYIHKSLENSMSSGSLDWINFLIGTATLFGVTLILLKLKFSLKKIFIFTIGLPAFIFLFKIARDHSFLKNIS